MDENNISELFPSVDVTDDREARSKFWIAAYTRPRSEKKAALELRKIGVETYVPIQKQLRIWSDRRKFVEIPVIPMIFFAKISVGDFRIIREHPLVIRILSQPGKKDPAHIPTDQIDNLKYMLGQSEIPVSFENGHFKTDDLVTIVRGSLKGLIGQVKDIKDDMTEVWVSLDFLGGALLRIKSTNLHKIDKNNGV